jgi:DNA (cytosine-5)-methyltransferase 1
MLNMVNINDVWNLNQKTEITFVDLFCGAGGVSKGYEMAGLKPIAAVDFFKSACETHRKNIDCDVVDGDITLNETKEKLYEIVKNKLNGNELDILHASTPCQGFSMAGKRMIDDPRNILYKEAVEIISKLKPKWITMENVPGMVSMIEGEVVKQICEDLENIGYSVKWTLLNAADYLTPQTRQRWILIGNRVGKEIEFPEPLTDKEHYVTVGQAIGDLMELEENKEFNHVFTKHSDEMKERLLAVEEGKSLYEKYPESWRKSPWNEPSCTIKENHGAVNIHPRLPRVITPREMARLQSFPDDFIFCGSKKDQLVQIGNAVPCNLAKAIGLAIVKCGYNE